MEHKLIIPPPDTPPTQNLMSGAVIGGTMLMAAGAADLAMSVAGDCLTQLNMILGLLELGFGGLLLWWVIRHWLARCEARLGYYEAELEHYQAHGRAPVQQQGISQGHHPPAGGSDTTR